MNDDFKAELRNVARFMNSEDVKIDEGTIKRFCDELTALRDEPGFAHKVALQALDREIWAALDEINPEEYIACVKASVKDIVARSNPKSESLYNWLDAKNMESTCLLFRRIDWLIQKKAIGEAIERTAPKD